MTFHSDKYAIARGVISPELAKFLSNYFLLKRKVCQTFRDTGFTTKDNTSFGFWEDGQVPNTYSHYADIAMETMLTWLQPKAEEYSGLKLTPQFSYARIYKHGDVLARHLDRPSCEISATLNLGGDPWSIYFEPDIEVNLTPGDMIIYSGCEIYHWRDKFKGDVHIQTFLHYSSTNSQKCDFREHLGLPEVFRQEN